MTNPNVAIVTGGASGVGFAIGKEYAARGYQVVLVDIASEQLDHAAAEIGATAMATDITDQAAVARMATESFALGPVTALVNNAGIAKRTACTGAIENWSQIMNVNLFGALNVLDAFVPRMKEAGLPATIIQTGSKQGITTPPGNPAYNASKSALKVLTEQLCHEMRNDGAPISVHLLVPGFTYTGMIKKFLPEKPAGAWDPEQVATFLFERLARGDFYIICPDNDVTEAEDKRRMAWSALDPVLNRPALSRWHPDYEDEFAAFKIDAQQSNDPS